MRGFTTPASWFGSSRASLIAFGAAAIAALALSLGAYLAIGYESEVAAARQSTEKAVTALNVHVRAVITAADGVLKAAIRDLDAAKLRGVTEPAAISRLLKANVEGQGTIGSLWLVDADGTLVAGSPAEAVPPLKFANRPGFDVHRQGSAADPIIGIPTLNPMTGRLGFTVSRRLTTADGRFAGVLVAGIPEDIFVEFFRSLQVGANGNVTLTRLDGIILARDPAEGFVGASLAQAPLFRDQLPKAASGTYRVMTLIDRVDRIISYRTMPGLPLVVSVGVSIDDALADWYRAAEVYIGIWLLCAAVLAAFTALMVRQATRRETAEDAARDAEQRFQHLVANVPGCVFQRVLKPNGTIGYNFVSAYAEELFGYRPEEILRNPSLLVDCVHPDHRQAFFEGLHRSAATLTPFSLELVSVRADRDTRWVHTVSIPERRPSGEIVWDGVMLDIGDRKRAEIALRDSEQRFQRLVANLPGCVFQRLLKPDGTLGYNFLSPQVEALFGYTAEELVRDASLLVEATHDEDRPVLLEAMHKSARDLTPMVAEVRTRRRNGEIGWVQTMSTPYRLADGTVVWDGFAIDISDRKRSDAALKRSEAEASRARALLLDAIDSLDQSFTLFDADDRLVMMNRVAREYHPEFAAAAVPGTPFAELIRVGARTGRLAGPGVDTEEIVRRRLQNHRKAYGSVIERQVGERWYHVREHPTSDGGVVVLRTEVTELKQANLRLAKAMTLAQEASRAKSEFLAMMSHELRTPLNVVIGFAELLRKHGGNIPADKIVDYAGDVHEAASHLLNLINDVLDLSKAEAGKIELQRTAVDVPTVIRRSLRMIQERATRREIRLVEEVAPGLPVIWADERKLVQILLNLLSNAVKFTPEGGTVTIAAAHDPDDFLTIKVIDTGIGIASENIDRALSAFGQIDNQLTRGQTGTGLGLPLAKRLAELHGATLTLQSEVGQGTTVTVRFPVVYAWSPAHA